jgi:hypothetical protein
LTHRGAPERALQGVRDIGKSVTIPGIDVRRVDDGKIAEYWARFDLIGVAVQIGTMPAPALTALRSACASAERRWRPSRSCDGMTPGVFTACRTMRPPT